MSDDNKNRDFLPSELRDAVRRFIEEHYIPGRFGGLSAPAERWKGAEAEAPRKPGRPETEHEEEPEEAEAPREPEYAEAEWEHPEAKRKGRPEDEREELPEDEADYMRLELEDEEVVLSSPSRDADRFENAKMSAPSAIPEDLLEYLDGTEATFSTRLLQLIDEKGYTDAEVYKRAHVDRKLFSKIRSNKDYIPRKRNVIALSLALRLNMDETNDLLRRAGMALSHSSKADLIAEYCILNGIYNINIVNELLDEYGEPILG